MKRRPQTPIKVEKINMSAEQIRYLLSRIETKIGKDEFPNYRVPFNELTPEQKESLRGPQGNSGILGDINNISLEIVNDLNGGESTSKTLRALSAEQGKVLHQLVKNNKTTLEQQIKNVFAQLPIINISQRTGRYGISLEDAVSYIQLEWVESYGGGIIILFMDEKDMWNAYMYNYDSDAGGYDDVTNYKKLSWDYDEIIALKAIINSIDINVGHNTEDIVRLRGDLNTAQQTLNGRIDALGSVYSAQGSKNSLTELLAVTSAKKGYVYSIESEFYLNGKYYAAGTNVVCITEFSSASENKSSNWDALGGTFNASLYLEKEKAAIANKSDITSGIDRKEDITYTEKGKQYISGGALGSVLPFKLISKTTLDNGDIAWYRLAFNYPTGSSNGAQQLLLQYAVTSNQSEPSAWTTINYINDINFKDISSIKTAVTNLTKNLQDNYFNKDEVQEEITKWLNEITNFLSTNYYNKLQVDDIIKEAIDTIGPTGGGISGLLNLKDTTAVRTAQDSITKNGESKTYIITDGEGNYPSPNVPTVYLDDAQALMDILYRGNGDALKFLLSTREAYYQYSVPFFGTHWYSQNISQYVKLPTFNLTTARVGDLVTIIRQELDAGEFYSKYIDFDSITIEDELFQAYKKSNDDTKNLTDGQFIKFLLLSGQIYSCPVNPEEDSSVTPVQLVSGDKVVLYTAQITPNIQHVYSGEFWSGNINAPGIYCYVTSGRPEGTTEHFIGVVSKDGTKMLLSMKNPSNNYIYLNGGWRWIGVGKNVGGTGEVFNDYAGNFAHNDHGHAEGQKTYASWNSHAEGFTTTAGSPNTGNAHSEGNTTKAIGNNSHAEGINTIAGGHNSHAEGDSTQATFWNAHAEGYRTNARGNGSHAEGNSDGFDTHNEAIGMGSHVEGGGTQAISDYAHAEGTCNMGIVDAIHEVGIGTNDVHKNAHTIMKDGKHFVYGVGGYDGTNHGQAKDLATIINSLGSIIDMGTLDEAQIRGLCESYETGIFSFIDESLRRCILFKPYQPTGNYNFLCIVDGVTLQTRGGDNNGHGGWSYTRLEDRIKALEDKIAELEAKL